MGDLGRNNDFGGGKLGTRLTSTAKVRHEVNTYRGLFLGKLHKRAQARGPQVFDAGRQEQARQKKVILEHHDGKRRAAPIFHISNSDGERAGFNLLIVEKGRWDKDSKITDRYVVFATNTPCRTREELVETLPETYHRRWIIETGFRVIKDALGKTCSNALHVRLFLLHFALLLYNL